MGLTEKLKAALAFDEEHTKERLPWHWKDPDAYVALESAREERARTARIEQALLDLADACNTHWDTCTNRACAICAQMAWLAAAVRGEGE